MLSWRIDSKLKKWKIWFMLPKTVKTYKNITLTITETTNKIKIKYMSHYAECTTYNN